MPKRLRFPYLHATVLQIWGREFTDILPFAQAWHVWPASLACDAMRDSESYPQIAGCPLFLACGDWEKHMNSSLTVLSLDSGHSADVLSSPLLTLKGKSCFSNRGKIWGFKNTSFWMMLKPVDTILHLFAPEPEALICFAQQCVH